MLSMRQRAGESGASLTPPPPPTGLGHEMLPFLAAGKSHHVALPERHSRHLLSAVRGDHRLGLGDLAAGVPDPVAGHGGGAAEAARPEPCPAAQAGRPRCGRLVWRLGRPPVQRGLRLAVGQVRPADRPAGAHRRRCPGDLRRPAGLHRLAGGRGAASDLDAQAGRAHARLPARLRRHRAVLSGPHHGGVEGRAGRLEHARQRQLELEHRLRRAGRTA